MPYPMEQLNDGSMADRNFRGLARDMNPPVPQASVANSANLVIATGTETTLTFDTERFDNGSLHDTGANTGRLTAPITGLYLVGASVSFASNVTGRRYARLRTNGALVVDEDRRPAHSSDVTSLRVEKILQLTAGDYAEVRVFQNSGGNLNIETQSAYSPEFWMVRLGGYVNAGV